MPRLTGRLNVFDGCTDMTSGLEYRNCPYCGKDDFEVVFESNMKADDLRQRVETVYMIPGGKRGRHVRCRNCRLVYVNPIEKAGEIEESYHQRSSADAAVVQDSRLSVARSQIALIARYGHGQSLLDIGCGEGFFLSMAARSGYSVRGVDLSSDAAEYARRTFGVDVEAKSLEEMQFAENSFDVVTLWQVLEHVPYPLGLLKEVHRILRPRGLLIVSTPDFDGAPARVLRTRWWDITRLHINHFTGETLTAILQKAQFRHTSCVSYRGYISMLMILIQVLKLVRLHKRLRRFLQADTALGRAMTRMVLAYPARLNYSTVVGFK